ncbi:MAG: DegT/DnrJ/EryC1/StrS family aminotransferase [Candidatus Woesearchaeota archaeon]
MKNKLALNGGTKIINSDDSKFIWPEISNETKKYVLNQLDENISIYNRSGIIERLEEKLKEYHNVKHAILTNSGTSALHSMYVGENFKEGDEVLVPAYTFYATVTPLFFTGATPVLVDCDKNGNLDFKDLENKITSKSKGVVVTHMWGVPADMENIKHVANKNNLSLMEDGSHAHGASYHGQKIGTFGNSSAFSMQGQKTLTGGEGGFLLTKDDEVFYRALLLGHYNKRCKLEIPKDHGLSKFSTTGMGLKLRSHPLANAIAEQQFEHLEEILNGRRKIAKYMIDSLKDLRGIELPIFDESIQPSWYAFIIKYNSEELENLSREKFFEALQAEGLSEVDMPSSTCPLNYLPLFQNPGELFPNYMGKVIYAENDFPNATKFHSKLLKLPVWYSENDMKKVNAYIQGIRKVVENYKELL